MYVNSLLSQSLVQAILNENVKKIIVVLWLIFFGGVLTVLLVVVIFVLKTQSCQQRNTYAVARDLKSKNISSMASVMPDKNVLLFTNLIFIFLV